MNRDAGGDAEALAATARDMYFEIEERVHLLCTSGSGLLQLRHLLSDLCDFHQQLQPVREVSTIPLWAINLNIWCIVCPFIVSIVLYYHLLTMN